MTHQETKVFLAVTGASGSVYGERLLQWLVENVGRIYLVASKSGRQVAQHELKKSALLRRALEGEKLSEVFRKKVRIFQSDDLFAPVASGSSTADVTIVAPCSMGTLARISHGVSENLIERAADVALKQKKGLVLVPRESPFNAIHLENMLKLSRIGSHIVPAMPGFYNHPKSLEEAVDFVVGKTLEAAGFSHDLYPPWNTAMR